MIEIRFEANYVSGSSRVWYYLFVLLIIYNNLFSNNIWLIDDLLYLKMNVRPFIINHTVLSCLLASQCTFEGDFVPNLAIGNAGVIPYYITIIMMETRPIRDSIKRGWERNFTVLIKPYSAIFVFVRNVFSEEFLCRDVRQVLKFVIEPCVRLSSVT